MKVITLSNHDNTSTDSRSQTELQNAYPVVIKWKISAEIA
jgi:hypothetical protein